MTQRIRAFVAIELPPQVKDTLAALVKALKAERIRGLRPVGSEGIHLTLKFLGDVPPDRIGPISDALSRIAADHSPFTLQLSGVGAFPERSSPRVLWVGLDGDLEALAELQRVVEDALGGLGFPRERRAFSPHLTVARIRDGTPPADRLRARDALLSAGLCSSTRMRVDGLSLMRSILRPDGARYDRMASLPLGSLAQNRGRNSAC